MGMSLEMGMAVEEMPGTSDVVQEGVQVGLVSQVVEEMPGTSELLE